ncbi:MAG: PorT family protein [Bacteroidota bacterium]|nr:PorT family protein [Bacteroidota bacterium]
MKKSVLFVFIGLLFSITSVQAQKQGFGLRAGINTTSVDNKIAISPHFGAYYSIVITESFGLQPELLYSVQPTHFNVNNVKATRNLSYFNLPIMAKIYVANGFNLQFGPYVGMLASLRSDDDADVSLKANFKEFDYGVGLGAAYEFPAGFNLGARYNLGLADVSSNAINTTGAVATFDTKNTNQYMQFFIGYTF